MNNYTHPTIRWAPNNSLKLMDSMNNTQWETEENSLADMELIVEGVAIPVITTLGLVGNILSIIVLHSPGIDMKVEKFKEQTLFDKTRWSGHMFYKFHILITNMLQNFIKEKITDLSIKATSK